MKKQYSFQIILIFIAIMILGFQNLYSEFPEYGTNPFEFTIQGNIYYGSFFTALLNSDTLPDFTFRSVETLYAYDHYGSLMWSVNIDYPGPNINNHGTKHGAADIDGDGDSEVVALDDADRIWVLNGASGSVERTFTFPGIGLKQKASHIVVVNLRGYGDRDVIVQTSDVSPECLTSSCDGEGYYINRTLIAINLDTEDTLWTVKQDGIYTGGNKCYEGHWGQAHGPLFCADVDGDGLDEVVGGNMIDHDGSEVDLGYPDNWIDVNTDDSFIDHLDCIAVGDFRQDLPGLEWVVTEEDHTYYSGSAPLTYNTTLMSKDGIIWFGDAESIFTYRLNLREPQNVCVGNFGLSRQFCEVWVRSRIGGTNEPHPYDSQRPWVFDASAELFAWYKTSDKLPDGFNSHPTYGNYYGIEMVWTIDWTGGKKEHIVGKARYVNGHVGVFDAVYLDSLWTTMDRSPNMKCSMLYAADIAGDTREEIILYDEYDGKIKVFWNSKINTNQVKPWKWHDPLYKRLKQNWNYYSPGSYTTGDYPLISNISITDIGINSATIHWITDEMADSHVEYGETTSYEFGTESDPVLKTSHSIQITGLSVNMDHHLRVKSQNQSGRWGISRDTVLTLLSFDSLVISDIVKNSADHLELSWNSVQGVLGYNVYRDTIANFVPDTSIDGNCIGYQVQDQDPGIADIQWTDQSIVIEPGKNYFYTVSAVAENFESNPSNTMGIFTYPLVSHFNAICLALDNSATIETADELSDIIPGCRSVAVWDPSHQGYQQYVPALPFTNFSVEGGYPYYVNVSNDIHLTFLGEVISPIFNLVTTGTTNFNEVMLPLDRNDLTWASELCGDISHCTAVAFWDAGIQGYVQYDPGIPSSDFEVHVGYPYLVHVTQSGQWPTGGGGRSLGRITTHSNQEGSPEPEGSHAPHLVWGHLEPDGSQVGGAIGYRAHIIGRAEEVLTDQSPGCSLKEGIWMVQCGGFGSPWRAGERLRVEFEDQESHVVFVVEVTLSYHASDSFLGSRIEGKNGVLRNYGLIKVYPNPFNPETKISYRIANSDRVRLEIVNVRGQRIKTLVDAVKQPGTYQIQWKGLDDYGNEVSSGSYIVKMICSHYEDSKKIILIR